VTPADCMISHIRGLTKAWQNQDYEAVAQYYHPDVVLLPPDAGAPIIGRNAVVSSYTEFAAAKLIDFIEEGFDTFEFDSTGVCHMRFQVEYALDGSHQRERGLEVYVLTNIPAAPQIIWRSQSLTEIFDITPGAPTPE